jgi:hypothetical protein
MNLSSFHQPFFRWTFHYPHFSFSLKTPIPLFFLHFATLPKPNHKLYSLLIISFPSHVTHAFDSQSFLLSSSHVFPISKLPTPTNSCITYNMPNIVLPPLNLFLAELGLRGLRVPFSFLCNDLSHLLIVHIITHITRFIGYKFRISFPSIQPSYGRPLMSLGRWFFSDNFAWFLC